jgi:hypothetical protein
VIGQAVMMQHDVPDVDRNNVLGPEAGNRPLNLGFSEALLSDLRPESEILEEVAARSELLDYLN